MADLQPKIGTNFLIPRCGSGRLLLALYKESGSGYGYWGIDFDEICIKMAAINMFLSGMKGEVMCTQLLDPEEFRFSYIISRNPRYVLKINKKEESELWNTYSECAPEIERLRKGI